MIGYQQYGEGLTRVIILNDWFSDTSTWDGARDYLDTQTFTWVFADLRGYGRSRNLRGSYCVTEAAADVLDVADTLGWSRFAVIGHSMSTLVALHLAQTHADRIERAIVLTPPPPAGFGADEARLESMRALALADATTQLDALRARWAGRLSEGWIAFKAARWRATADPQAAAEYAAMFGRDGMPDPLRAIAVPVLAVTGEHDLEIMRRESVARHFERLCPRLSIMALSDCGHYPMQEAPPRLVAIVERFLAARS